MLPQHSKTFLATLIHNIPTIKPEIKCYMLNKLLKTENFRPSSTPSVLAYTWTIPGLPPYKLLQTLSLPVCHFNPDPCPKIRTGERNMQTPGWPRVNPTTPNDPKLTVYVLYLSNHDFYSFDKYLNTVKWNDMKWQAMCPLMLAHMLIVMLMLTLMRGLA